MTLTDSLVSFSLSPEPGAVVLGGHTIPAAVLVCSNCGWIDFHALGTLGMFDNPLFQANAGELK